MKMKSFELELPKVPSSSSGVSSSATTIATTSASTSTDMNAAANKVMHQMNYTATTPSKFSTTNPTPKTNLSLTNVNDSIVRAPSPSMFSNLFQQLSPNGKGMKNNNGDDDSCARGQTSQQKAYERFCIQGTLFINFTLAIVKLIAFLTSFSMAVLASLVDSCVDLFAQSVLLYANRAKAAKSALYPAGRARIEPVGVVVRKCSRFLDFFFPLDTYCTLACAFISSQKSIDESAVQHHEFYLLLRQPNLPCPARQVASAVMGMASLEVIRESIQQLVKQEPSVDMSISANVIVAAIIFIKIVIWRLSKTIAIRTGSSSVEAISQDNFNDILSNASAMLFANLGSHFLDESKKPDNGGAAPSTGVEHSNPDRPGNSWWMIDPAGAILISMYIIYSWVSLGIEQVQILVGKVADREFLDEVRRILEEDIQSDKLLNSKNVTIDKLTAYHFGPKFLVEVELVMPEDTLLRESHDCGIRLQHHVESLSQVERCFVHIDYAVREVDDHDPGAPLALKTYCSGSASGTGEAGTDGLGVDPEQLEALLVDDSGRDDHHEVNDVVRGGIISSSSSGEGGTVNMMILGRSSTS
ncbi:unnamed protein product [Amoebophrya sp. A120]|nr:unnamed protein product [Amoebophrya sp. A120]|eukprot:GSA120T00016137001.1